MRNNELNFFLENNYVSYKQCPTPIVIEFLELRDRRTAYPFVFCCCCFRIGLSQPILTLQAFPPGSESQSEWRYCAFNFCLRFCGPSGAPHSEFVVAGFAAVSELFSPPFPHLRRYVRQLGRYLLRTRGLSGLPARLSPFGEIRQIVFGHGWNTNNRLTSINTNSLHYARNENSGFLNIYWQKKLKHKI